MPERSNQPLTVREYARREGITIQTAYRRIWDGQVPAQQFLGRWLISLVGPGAEHNGPEKVLGGSENA